MDWKRLYAVYCVMSRSLTRECPVFRVPGVATQAKNNADRIVTCCAVEKKVSQVVRKQMDLQLAR